MKIHGKDRASGSETGSHSKARDDEIRRWLRARELGQKATLGHNNRLSRQLYSSVETTHTWDPMATADHQHHGGIFNFDFSKDGSVLVAACEKRSVLMFDPLNGQLITSKDQAHSDCVNCVRFLDSRLFATCSDDTTVNLWDVRYMKHKIRTLTAHSNWVKNIEFDVSSGLLVTSGFDGSIFTWDINRYSENEESYKQVFHTTGLMRMKLTPDASKLVVATGSGYLMVIHDLDLTTLSQDLDNFLPNMYRVMQQTNSPIPQAYEQNHVFTQTRNRVELISDFPEANKADMIASLEVHPQGWCVISRNTSTYEASEDTDCRIGGTSMVSADVATSALPAVVATSAKQSVLMNSDKKWTCVHDIQPLVDNHGDYNSLDQQSSVCDTSVMSHSAEYSIENREMPRHNPQVPPHNTTGENRDSSESPTATEPSRTGSPTFVLSISINERTGSPPRISQNYSTTTGTNTVVSPAGHMGEDEVDSLVEPADLLGSGSVQFDLSQPIAEQDSLEDSELAEDALQQNLSLLESVYHDTYQQLRVVTPTSTDSDELERQTSGHVASGSSVLNVPNSPPLSSPSSPPSSLSSSDSSIFVTHPTTPPPPTPRRHRRHRHPHHHLSAVDVLPRLRVHQVPSPLSTFQARWDNPNDSAFMPPPSSVATLTPLSHASAPISAGLRLGDSVTVLIRSRRQGRLLLLGQNASPKSTSTQPQPYIHLNHPRLTHYLEELNVGRGFIKEVAFSGDGRLICSPFGFGVRLLAFDPSCSEMCDVIHRSPVKLYEVASTTGHQRSVVTTKFSPLHCMFVSGCLAGKINFNQPRL